MNRLAWTMGTVGAALLALAVADQVTGTVSHTMERSMPEREVGPGAPQSPTLQSDGARKESVRSRALPDPVPPSRATVAGRGEALEGPCILPSTVEDLLLGAPFRVDPADLDPIALEVIQVVLEETLRPHRFGHEPSWAGSWEEDLASQSGTRFDLEADLEDLHATVRAILGEQENMQQRGQAPFVASR